MVRNFVVRHDRFAELFVFDVFTVVLTYRNRCVDDVRNDHHLGAKRFTEFCFFFFKHFKTRVDLLNARFFLIGFVDLLFLHQTADEGTCCVALGTQIIAFALERADLGVNGNAFVNKRQLFVLEFLFDVFFDNVGIFSDKSNV